MQLTGSLLVSCPRPLIGCLQEALVRGQDLVHEAVDQCRGAADDLGAGDRLRERLVVAVVLTNPVVRLHGPAHATVGCTETGKTGTLWIDATSSGKDRVEKCAMS